MWQAYAVGSLVGNALENVIDKAAFVRDAHVDDIVATFWRQIAFFVLTLAVGIAGWMGPIHFFFSWELFGMCMLTVLSALAYTYMLRHAECRHRTPRARGICVCLQRTYAPDAARILAHRVGDICAMDGPRRCTVLPLQTLERDGRRQ